MKFQDKFYDIIDHDKCPSSENSTEKCILRKSYFHHSEPRYMTDTMTIQFSIVGVEYTIFSDDMYCKNRSHDSMDLPRISTEE